VGGEGRRGYKGREGGERGSKLLLLFTSGSEIDSKSSFLSFPSMPCTILTPPFLFHTPAHPSEPTIAWTPLPVLSNFFRPTNSNVPTALHQPPSKPTSSHHSSQDHTCSSGAYA
jgi:hypothetical protein